MHERSDRVVIEAVAPEIDGGRFPIKRTRGESVQVEADVLVDGHDVISAILLFRRARDEQWSETPMTPLVNDRWRGGICARKPTPTHTPTWTC
jgi:starch synthase (maltosyl-transferring)